MIKAIFLDVDGTLISFNTHHIPQTALDALRQAYHSGCKLIIATGRSAADLQVIREVPYEAVISLNGAECVLRDFTPIYKKLIPAEDFHKALELSKKYDFPLALETNEGIFVNKLNLDKGGAFIENQIAYFVSLNSDLITFASRPGIIPSVIHASKVIMSLWIHSSRSENVQKELLAEVMSRCFALNQTDVRHKLRLFQRHYKDCSLTKEDISHMYTSLIKRSANTINEVDKLSQIEVSDQDDKDIISREIICGVIAAANKENADLNTAMLSMQAGMESLKHKVEEMSKIVEEVNFAKDSQGSIIKQYEADINLSHETIDGLKNEIKIYKRIVEIESLINTHKGKLHTFAEERKASVRLFKYWFNIVYE